MKKSKGSGSYKKGQGSANHLPYNILAVWKKVGKRGGDGNVWEENQDINKTGVGKNTKM